MKKQRGFTLVELVVVISIVLVLGFVVLMSLNSSRSKARDGQRISDVNTIGQAMAQYNISERSYPYWELTGSKRGIFNKQESGMCSESYACIYNATAGSSWRNFLDSYLTSRPISPKDGTEWQYYYNAENSTDTPPSHYSVGTRLESSNYTATKTANDPWYLSGYCEAADCGVEFPGEKVGWFYVVGG